MVTVILLVVVVLSGYCQAYSDTGMKNGSTHLTTVKSCYTLMDDVQSEHFTSFSNRFHERIGKNIDSLGIQIYPGTKDLVLFDIPVRASSGLTDPGIYVITAYYDHNTSYPDQVEDYQCGTFSYDLSGGYNHSGTDFFLWPFPWLKMDNEEVEVVAAADGVIVYKQDGNYDRNCENNYEDWNAVYLLHADGSQSWYGHLKANSLTNKEIGESVSRGEFLGIPGSSGSSLAPHLHFEVYDSDNKLIDPFMGPCNNLINESKWLDQLPYMDAGINKISTNHTLPIFPECPEQEITNETNQFFSGDTIFLLSYYRYLNTGDTIITTIKRPDGSKHSEWEWVSTLPFYAASWTYSFIILQEEMEGDWIYNLAFKGKSYEHYFQFKNTASIESGNDVPGIKIFPNPAHESIQVLWQDDTPEIEDIQLCDIFGQKITDIQIEKRLNNIFHVTFSEPIAGIYVLRIKTASKVICRKIFVY